MSWALVITLSVAVLVIAGAMGNGARGAAQVALVIFLSYWLLDTLKWIKEIFSKKDRDRG